MHIVNPWINTKDKLPEQDDKVLIILSDDSIILGERWEPCWRTEYRQGWSLDDGRFISDDDWEADVTVALWQPIVPPGEDQPKNIDAQLQSINMQLHQIINMLEKRNIILCRSTL